MSAFCFVSSYQTYYAGYWGLSWYVKVSLVLCSSLDTDGICRGWVIPAVLQFSSALAIAELASSMPVNGAFYWWTSALAKPRFSRFSAFVTGWIIVMSLMCVLASFTWGLSAFLFSIIPFVQPDFVPTKGQQLGMSYGLVIFWVTASFLRAERMTYVFYASSESRPVNPWSERCCRC